jgi:hypothetical protein
MKSRLKQVAVMVVGILPLVAVARSVPGSTGRPEFWNDGPCFRVSFSSIQNTCATRKSFEIPLSVDSSGSKTVVVSAQGATSANNVGCAAMGVNRELTIAWGGTRKWLTVFGSAQLITLTDASVPTRGYLYVNCQVDNGGWVHAIDYNP